MRSGVPKPSVSFEPTLECTCGSMRTHCNGFGEELQASKKGSRYQPKITLLVLCLDFLFKPHPQIGCHGQISTLYTLPPSPVGIKKTCPSNNEHTGTGRQFKTISISCPRLASSPDPIPRLALPSAYQDPVGLLS